MNMEIGADESRAAGKCVYFVKCESHAYIALLRKRAFRAGLIFRFGPTF